MRLPLLLLLLPAVLALSSCGREEEIVVKFEDSRPPSPPSSAPSVPTPQPTPVPPTPAKPPQKPPVAVVKPPPGRYPHAVAIFCEAPFFPSVAVTFTPTGTTTGTAPIHDLASRDGFGAAGKLGLLPPGEYTLVLNSSRLGSYPMLETTVTVDGHEGTSVTLGFVKFNVQAKALDEIGKGILVEILEEPSRKSVFRGPLGQMKTDDSAGGQHPMTLVLPLGTYTYALSDLDPNDRVSIMMPGGKAGGLIKPGEGNSFTLAQGHSATIVDLRSALVLK